MPVDLDSLAASFAPDADSYVGDLDAGVLDGECDVVLDAGADVETIIA